nr:MAG TPA: hypothetical protein [Caudoviricetes sp.]
MGRGSFYRKEEKASDTTSVHACNLPSSDYLDELQ